MAIKSIYIDPETILKLVVAARNAQGESLIPVPVEPGAKVVGAGWNVSRNELTINVEAKDFDEGPATHGHERQPQSYNVRLK